MEDMLEPIITSLD